MSARTGWKRTADGRMMRSESAEDVMEEDEPSMLLDRVPAHVLREVFGFLGDSDLARADFGSVRGSFGSVRGSFGSVGSFGAFGSFGSVGSFGSGTGRTRSPFGRLLGPVRVSLERHRGVPPPRAGPSRFAPTPPPPRV